MLDTEIKSIVDGSKINGWIMEPEAKEILSIYKIPVPIFNWVLAEEDAIHFANQIGYPVAAKIVSPSVIHKSDVGGVIVGIDNDDQMANAFNKFSKLDEFSGVLVEAMAGGIELIVGAKVDYQFGPVVLLGMGGIGVEIYQDTALRMAPLKKRDVQNMLDSLTGKKILQGYRGAKGINFNEISKIVVRFSNLVMDLENEIESIDLNPVLCTHKKCVVADARIMLRRN